MEWLFKHLRKFIAKKYDLIERAAAPYYSEVDVKKVFDTLDLLRARKERLGYT